MILWLRNHYFRLQLRFLGIFKPTVLFHRINQLSWYKTMLQEWADIQGFTMKSKVLEVGCATGMLTNHLSSSGYIPTGVDYSGSMIELAQSNYSHIDFSVASVLQLPFETESYDGVIAASLMNIITDQNKAIEELFRVCKKGGRVTILVPLAGFDDTELHLLQSLPGNTGFSIAAMEAWHRLAPKMRVGDMVSLFEYAGLADITTTKHLQGMAFSISALKPL